MIQHTELHTPHLAPVARAMLLTAANVVDQGYGEVTVSITYTKQTDTKPRIAGEDYVAMLGVVNQAQSGPLVVRRYTDNKLNRKLNRVGKIYLRIRSVTRADGAKPIGHTNIRPEGITGFVVLGTRPYQRAVAQ
jgi:hypothetical protein